ncbi:peptide MFS transporter [Legionella dresdenensis]|uniref:Peptide MFS transporter n=1 Tax=Legionella dresdenensis TaxID=450200 RepID=A0ABV8CB39_9GAMM
MSTKERSKSALSNMPEGIIALFYIQLFSTLSFSVLYSTLVLYMTGPLALSIPFANNIMGVFVAFNFALHLLGGYWGGRFFSNRTLFCIGMAAQIIGCLLLALVNQEFLYYGLAAFLAGSGLNVTCLNCMITQRFQPQDTRRETAFLYSYASMNVGFFIGYSLSGYFQLSNNYQQLFLLSSIGNLFALIFCLYNWQALADKETSYSRLNHSQKRQWSFYGIIMVLALPVLLSQLLHSADLSSKLVLITGLIILGAIYWLATKQPSQNARHKLFAFAVLIVIGTLFWTLYQIGPMGLTHFINHNVQRNISGLVIPPQWYQNINTLCIVAGGPLLGILFHKLRARGIEVNIPVQFALALLFIGLAFALLPVGILFADSYGMVGSGWIILSFVLQSAGELLISPIGYAMIGALAPANLQGVMMGMWMMATGVGATLSSYSSNWMTVGRTTLDPVVTNSGYSQVFLILGLLAIIAGIALLFIAPALKRWMGQEQGTEAEESALAVA